MAVPRRVGNAVRRNRIKRLIRSAFREVRGQWTDVIDVVVVVTPHGPAHRGAYANWLNTAIQAATGKPEKKP